MDTEGLLLRVVVHSAGIRDGAGGESVAAEPAAPGRLPPVGAPGPGWRTWTRLAHLWVDGAHGSLVDFAARYAGLTVDLIRGPAGTTGFQVVPRRWVAERTFGRFGRCRALSKDDEALPESSEAWCYLAMTHLMLRRFHPH